MMDKEMTNRIFVIIDYTWNAIASDVMACDEESSCDLDTAVEACIDADRVRAFGGDDEAADALYALGSYKEMQKLGRIALKDYF